MRRMILALSCFLAMGLSLAGESRATVPAGGAAPAGAVEMPAHGSAAGHGGAEEGGQPDLIKEELNLGTLIVTIIVFLCLMGVLMKTAWKPILTGLRNREQTIRESIEAAKRAKEEAERTTRTLEAKMAEVQRQGAAQLQQAKNDALKIAETIRSQAEAESTALKDRTLRDIEAAKQQAVSEINDHAAELGTAVARKILQRNVTVDDQQRLVEESLSELARKN
jgi:F-type H+-transporting ATPase subunit b